MTIATDIPTRRKGQYLQETLRFLSNQPDGASPCEVFDAVRHRLNVSGVELAPYDTQPDTEIETIIRFTTLRATKAQWMVKRDGTWYITEAGKDALVKYTESEGSASRFDACVPSLEEGSRCDRNNCKRWGGDRHRLGTARGAEASFTLDDAKERARDSIRVRLKDLDPYEFQDMVAALLRGMGYYIYSSGTGQGSRY